VNITPEDIINPPKYPLISFKRAEFEAWLKHINIAYEPPEEVRSINDLTPEEQAGTRSLGDYLEDPNVTIGMAEVNPGPIYDNFLVRSLGLNIDNVPLGLMGFVFTSSDGRMPELRVAYLGGIEAIRQFKAVLTSQCEKTIQNIRKRGGK
jgi:hypothetical protein